MKKSNLITIAFCAFLLVAGGGVGAYAADQIGGDQIADGTLDGGEIQNESVTGADIDNGTLTGADIRNQTLSTNDIAAGSVNDALIQNGAVDGGEVRDETLTGHDLRDGTVEWQDLGPGVSDGLLANIEAGGALDNNGQRSVQWVDADADFNSYLSFQVPSGDHLIALDVRSDVPVKVTLVGVSHTLSCVAVPADGFGAGTCSALRQFSGEEVAVIVRGPNDIGVDSTLVDIEVNGFQVGG